MHDGLYTLRFNHVDFEVQICLGQPPPPKAAPPKVVSDSAVGQRKTMAHGGWIESSPKGRGDGSYIDTVVAACCHIAMIESTQLLPHAVIM